MNNLVKNNKTYNKQFFVGAPAAGFVRKYIYNTGQSAWYLTT